MSLFFFSSSAILDVKVILSTKSIQFDGGTKQEANRLSFGLLYQNLYACGWLQKTM